MSLPLFFSEHVNTDAMLVLDEDTSRHVIQVLRMKAGEQLQLTDGRGNRLTAEIADQHKKKCTVKVVRRETENAPRKKIAIAIALLKNSHRFEWFLEKATEIGVTAIIPLITTRTEKQHFRYDRMKNIVVSAMLQSQQVWLPELSEPIALAGLMPASSYTQKFIAHCEEEQKRSLLKAADPLADSVIILIGPEGDFTADEIEMAIDNKFIPVTLGKTRLRTETAGIVAAGLIAQASHIP